MGYYAIDKLGNFDWYLKELLNGEILEKLDFMRKWYLMKFMKTGLDVDLMVDDIVRMVTVNCEKIPG